VNNTDPIVEEIIPERILRALNTTLSGTTSPIEYNEASDRCMPLETQTAGVASSLTVRGASEL